MTKPKRVILLVTEILMLAAGVVGILIFATLTWVLSRHISVPTNEAIRAATGTRELRSMAEDSSGKYWALLEAFQTLRWYFLGLGTLLAAGSVIHFCLTPWKLGDGREKT
jgi:hypothetical protein